MSKTLPYILMFAFANISALAQRLIWRDEIINDSVPANIDIMYFNDFIQGTTDQEARRKLVNPMRIISYKNGIGRYEESLDRWPAGTWNSGYYDRWDDAFPHYKLTIHDCPVGERSKEKYNPSGFLSAHPLYWVNSKVIRALIHTNMLYRDAEWTHENNRKIKSGIDYLLSQQISSTDQQDFAKNEIGGFTKWYFRIDSLHANDTEDRQNNYAHVFETAHALRTMCEAYMYFKNYNECYGVESGNTQNMTALLDGIVRAADNIILKSIGRSLNGTAEEGNACDWSASNYRGLAVWALVAAYKVTKAENHPRALKYFDKALELSKRLVEFQSKEGLEAGMWLTGGTSGNADACGNAIEKDTYIWYHQLTLRGLVEMMDVATLEDGQWKKNHLIPAVKRAVNHLINHRVAFTDTVEYEGSRSIERVKGTLRTTWTTELHQPGCASWAYYYYEEVLEPIALLLVHSNYQYAFSDNERDILKRLLIVMGRASHVGYTSADPNTIEKFVQYAYYCSAMRAFERTERIYPIHENSQYAEPLKDGRGPQDLLAILFFTLYCCVVIYAAVKVRNDKIEI